MRMGMAIDLDACIGCQTCAAVCKVHNACSPKTWWNRVLTVGAAHHQTSVEDGEGNLHMDYLPLSCQHCDNAPCKSVCPTGATYTADDGTVLVDFDKCIGCRFCFSACPYGVRQFNWEDAAKAKEGYIEADYGYPDDVREGQQNHLVYTQNRPAGVTEKCTFCAEYTQKGELPACVRACPQRARTFGDLDDPESAPNKAMEGRQKVRLGESYGTEPKVWYLTSRKEALQNVE